MCENNPTEETLHEERRLILGLDVTREVRADLLAVAALVGVRYFARDVLEAVFREEMEMLKETSFILDWIEEKSTEAQAKGHAEGESLAARELLLQLLRRRFGALPENVVAGIRVTDLERCRELADRVFDAQSIEELGLIPNGNTSRG